MARFIRATNPRLFLFENVRGLLSSRWTAVGQSGEIWDDVRRTFEDIEGYDVRWELVQAKQYGVPQNRPRVLLVGIRRDLRWIPESGKPADGLLPAAAGRPPDPEDFLGDLVDPAYPGVTETFAYPSGPSSDSQRWFRATQSGDVAPVGFPITDQQYAAHRPRISRKFEYMLAHEGQIREQDRTKKFAQRLIPRQWGERGPTITTTSLPDDYVHFSQPRILTVREWARTQTFPDWYQFVGPRTTGGRRRAGDPELGDWSREVPKYTQIGNAVPVWLAMAVGTHFKDLLR
jgi:DNA (cytosine-5)-methyltransferase 1